jgi:hypothetical protein
MFIIRLLSNCDTGQSRRISCKPRIVRPHEVKLRQSSRPNNRALGLFQQQQRMPATRILRRTDRQCQRTGPSGLATKPDRPLCLCARLWTDSGCEAASAPRPSLELEEAESRDFFSSYPNRVSWQWNWWTPRSLKRVARFSRALADTMRARSEHGSLL